MSYHNKNNRPLIDWILRDENTHNGNRWKPFLQRNFQPSLVLIVRLLSWLRFVNRWKMARTRRNCVTKNVTSSLYRTFGVLSGPGERKRKTPFSPKRPQTCGKIPKPRFPPHRGGSWGGGREEENPSRLC